MAYLLYLLYFDSVSVCVVSSGFITSYWQCKLFLYSNTQLYKQYKTTTKLVIYVSLCVVVWKEDEKLYIVFKPTFRGLFLLFHQPFSFVKLSGTHFYRADSPSRGRIFYEIYI
jgi:hypothetical protein